MGIGSTDFPVFARHPRYFKLDAFDPKANVKRLVAFDKYWEGAPKIQTLVFKTVTDPFTGLAPITRIGGAVMLALDSLSRFAWQPGMAQEFPMDINPLRDNPPDENQEKEQA